MSVKSGELLCFTLLHRRCVRCYVKGPAQCSVLFLWLESSQNHRTSQRRTHGQANMYICAILSLLLLQHAFHSTQPTAPSTVPSIVHTNYGFNARECARGHGGGRTVHATKPRPRLPGAPSSCEWEGVAADAERRQRSLNHLLTPWCQSRKRTNEALTRARASRKEAWVTETRKQRYYTYLQKGQFLSHADEVEKSETLALSKKSVLRN